MQVIEMKLSDLRKSERNVRIHTQKQISEYQRSVQTFGQTKPFVVDETGLILIGNGLYDAMVGLGLTTASVVVKAGMTEKQKKKLMMADNRIYSLGIDDLQTVDDFLREMEGDLDIPGYDEDIIRQMEAEAEEVTEKVVQYGTLDEDRIEEIRRRGESAPPQQEVRQLQVPPAGISQAPAVAGQPLQSMPQGNYNPVADEAPQTTAETRRSVVCPKCGEVIWL